MDKFLRKVSLFDKLELHVSNELADKEKWNFQLDNRESV